MADVGRAEVQVTGDVRNFARQTERDLDRALSKIKVQKVEVEPDVDRNRFSNLLRKAFTPDPQMFSALRAPFAAALSTPVSAAVIAVAGTAAAAFVGAFAAALATAGLGAVFLGLGIAAVAGVKEVQSAASKLGDTLKSVGRAAARPLIQPLVAALGSLERAARRVQPLLTKIFDGLAPAIGPLTDGITGFVEEFLKVLTADPATLDGMRDALIAIGENLPRLGTALGQLFAMLAGNENNVRNIGLLFGLLEVTVGSLAGSLFVLSKTLDYLVWGWTNIINAGKSFVSWITGTAAPAIASAFAPVVPVITGIWRVISAVVVTAWKLIVNAVTTGIGVVRGVIAAVSAAISGDWSKTWTAIKSVVSAVLNGIRTAVSALLGGVRGAVSGALGAIRAAWTAGWNAMVSVVTGAASRVRSAVAGLRQTVMGAFAGAAGWLASAGRRIIDGLISGIRSGFGRVQGLLSSLTGMLPDWKGPAELDRKILEGSGRMVMEGFRRGIEGERDAIRRALQDVTGDLPAWTAGRPRGGDGAASGGSLSIAKIEVHVHGATGRDAGEEAAERILERLGQATLAR